MIKLASSCVLILLTLVGYSSGRVLGRRGRKVVPDLLDILAIIVLWASAIASQGTLVKWLASLFWLLIGLAVGTIVTVLRCGSLLTAERQTVLPVSGNLFQRGWERWKEFAHRMGNFQGRVLLIFFYFVIVPPFGFLVRVFHDPLRLRGGRGNSSWLERPTPNTNLDDARSQF